MATYVPITVTAENYDYAIYENIRMALEVLHTKLNVSKSIPMMELDAGGFKIVNVHDLGGDEDHAACTYDKLIELSSLLPLFLSLESGGFLLQEDGSKIKL